MTKRYNEFHEFRWPITHSLVEKCDSHLAAAREGTELKRVPRGTRRINSVMSQLVIGPTRARRPRDRRNQQGMIHECKRASYANARRVLGILACHTRIRSQFFSYQSPRSFLMPARHARGWKRLGGRKRACKEIFTSF